MLTSVAITGGCRYHDAFHSRIYVLFGCMDPDLPATSEQDLSHHRLRLHAFLCIARSKTFLCQPYRFIGAMP